MKARPNRIVDGVKEAAAIAKGETPAARITINGHAYVPEAALLSAETRGYERARERESRLRKSGPPPS